MTANRLLRMLIRLPRRHHSNTTATGSRLNFTPTSPLAVMGCLHDMGSVLHAVQELIEVMAKLKAAVNNGNHQ
jgi:hypothetical protein